eukprot:235762-Alexandrium_andersonii.AAC.1
MVGHLKPVAQQHTHSPAAPPPAPVPPAAPAAQDYQDPAKLLNRIDPGIKKILGSWQRDVKATLHAFCSHTKLAA